MPIFDGPCRTTDQRIVEIILFGLLNEQLPRFTFKRRNPSILHCRGAIPEAVKEFFYVDLSQSVLLMITATG